MITDVVAARDGASRRCKTHPRVAERRPQGKPVVNGEPHWNRFTPSSRAGSQGCSPPVKTVGLPPLGQR